MTNYEMQSYFGEFYQEYLDKAIEMIERLPWETIELYMDYEITEELSVICPCTQDYFLMNYFAKHTEKYGEDFVIN